MANYANANSDVDHKHTCDVDDKRGGARGIAPVPVSLNRSPYLRICQVNKTS
eukprot:c29361_g1_i1 orf=2-154(-)